MPDEDWVCVHVDEVGWTDDGDFEGKDDEGEVNETEDDSGEEDWTGAVDMGDDDVVPCVVVDSVLDGASDEDEV
ncbi:hypothetical protein SLS53_007207 [Cytospora paraplurivora]|uniref:Uncharacterized protein n=1 Tax=Cytospora paraplurivora TaxID=2898453 RepID=A0AAN9U387_9PEZI